MLTQDDTYEGYFLPKGTIFFANAWAIHMDEDEYDRPEEFIPNRFLNNKYGTRKPVDENMDDHRRVSYGFGAGRRVCPGQRLAKNSLVSFKQIFIPNCINYVINIGIEDVEYG